MKINFNDFYMKKWLEIRANKMNLLNQKISAQIDETENLGRSRCFPTIWLHMRERRL